MTALIILVVGALNIACFFVGAKVGQTVAKGEKIEAPNLNPMQAIKQIGDKKKEQKELDRVSAIMRNVEVYDGTDKGQEDIPVR